MKRLLTLLLIAVFLVGCTGGGGGGTGSSGGGTSTGSSGSTGSTGSSGSTGGGAQTIKIGLIAPLTGEIKTFGESTRNGFELALEQAGHKAGNFNIEYVVGDDKADPAEGVNLAEKMIAQDGVKAIVGSVTSGVSIPVAEVTNRNGIVSISGTATSEKLTVDDNGNRKPYAFRACFIDPFQGQVSAKFALNTLGAKTAAVLYDKGNDYTVGLAENFEKNFTAGGGEIVFSETYAKDDTDFSALVTNIANLNPDVLFLPDYYPKVSLIAAAVKDRGLNVTMMGGDGWDSSDLDYGLLDGGYFTNHYSPEDPRDEVQTFVSEYQNKYGEVPDALATLAYDATNILLEAIKQANSDDPEKIREAMQNLSGFQAVSGSIRFDELGNPVKSASILQVDGASRSYKFVENVSP